VKIDWARLNYILIPTQAYTRSKRRELPRVARIFLGIGSSLTDSGRVLLVATLLVGGFALDVSRTSAYVLFALLGGIVYTSLVAGRLLRPYGLKATLRGPQRAIAGEEVSFVVAARNENDDALHALRVRGPFLPHFGHYVERARVIDEVKPRAEAASVVTMRFDRRGDLHLGPFRVARMVPLGVATGPAVETADLKLRVVPRIAKIARLELPGGARHQPGGIPLASHTGESMDLRGVRPYRPGDPLRDLHARTWARTGTPYVREYQEEYFSRIGVVLDSDADDDRTFEAAISLVAGVLAKVSRGEALVDLLVVGDELHKLTIGRSLGFVDQALDELAVAERRRGFDAKRLAAALAPYASRLSAVVFVTTKWGAEREELVRALESRGPRVRAFLVGDERDSGTPAYRAVAAEAIDAGEALSL
jgi:uncharacterized protein (DUF58 family)